MKRALVLVAALSVGTAYADPPADAPVVLRVLGGHVRTPDGPVDVGPGTYLNEPAAINVARACTRYESEAAECQGQLERGAGVPGALVAALIAGAFVGGVAVGALMQLSGARAR